MPKTTTCFDVIFKGSKARDCFSCAALIPCSHVAWNQHRQERQDHSLCFSQKSLMAATMSCRLYCSLISSTPVRHAFIRSQSLQSIRSPCMCSPAKPPAALRIFAGTRPGLLPCHAKILHCATCYIRTSCFTGRPIRWHSLRSRSFFAYSLLGEPPQ